MRRLIANSVLLVILGTFFAPALTSVASPPVPLCCRRGGMHQCAMKAEMLRAQGTSFSKDNPCPMRQTSLIGPCSIGLPISGPTDVQTHDQWLVASGIIGQGFSSAPADNQRAPPSDLL